MAYEAFRIPNKVAAAFVAQSKVFDQDHQILAEAPRGNGIVYGVGACQVLPQAAPNMTVRLTTGGTVVSQGTAAAVTTGNVTIAAAHATLPRIDIVSVTNAGVKVATAGTPATDPLPPVIPQSGGVNNIVLAFVYVPAADTAIGAEQIIDKRVFVNTPGAGTGNVTTTGTPAVGNLTQFSGGTSITNGNLSGDVTTAGGLTTTIAADAVTFAKMQNVSAASRLLGRGAAAGAGDPQELTLGTNLSMSGTVLNASGSGGTVPTGTGFPHITGGTQDAAAKLVDTADINNAQVSYAKIQNVAAASRLLGRGAAGGAGSPEEIVLGTNLSMSGTTLNASGSGGTVPTGTGFTHITAGAQDAAAKLVDTADVNNDQVTYAKMQNVSAASKLLGRGDSGSGDPQEITLGANLTMTGTTLAASGTGGSITVRKNTGADVGTRPRLNLIEGSNVTLTVADDAGSSEVDITIAASGGSSSDILAFVNADVVHATNSTTLSNITGLTFNTTASATEVWALDITLLLNTNVSGASTVDYKFAWTLSGSQSGNWGGTPELVYGGPTVPPPNFPTLSTPYLMGGASVTLHVARLYAIIASNGSAGACQLQFAQNFTAAGAIITVKRASHFIARRIIA